MPKSKRPSFAFPELEGRGRHAILRPAPEVAAELATLERQAQAEAAAVKERIKVTYRFTPEAVEAVEDIRRILRRRYGVHKVNREEVAQEAVLEAFRQLEESGADSFLAKRFTADSL